MSSYKFKERVKDQGLKGSNKEHCVKLAQRRDVHVEIVSLPRSHNLLKNFTRSIRIIDKP